jgi:cobyrinic acid a,c-diamide synthase
LANGFVVAAPRSGSGKTVLTLGLLAALRARGTAVAPAKTGPDYIDAKILSRAAGAEAINLDPWAMTPERQRALATEHAREADLLVVEGVMGLFDGAADGTGSTADLAAALGLPVILVVDAEKQSQSIAALVHGFASWRADVKVAGLVINRVATTRHEQMLRAALEPVGIPVLGVVPRRDALVVPERHLGLVLPDEVAGFETVVAAAAEAVGEYVDLDVLLSLSGPSDSSPVRSAGEGDHAKHGGGGRPLSDLVAAPSTAFGGPPPPLRGGGSRLPDPRADGVLPARLPPLGQHIAIARDEAFAFLYAHWLEDWRAAGAELSFFSPLADEAPDVNADAVFLPGGYPELHAERLAHVQGFLHGLRKSRDRDALIYGECGGFMVLGDTLTDKDGRTWPMAGLLPVATRADRPRRTLGYRRLTHDSPLPWPKALTGHEFHYSSGVAQSSSPLFAAADALGTELAPTGAVVGRVMGSYAHVIDIAA